MRLRDYGTAGQDLPRSPGVPNLGLGLTSFAAYNGGGLFQRGVSDEEFYGMGYTSQYRDGLMPNIPNHGSSDNEDAPLGTGIALLVGLGGAYLVAKKRGK